MSSTDELCRLLDDLEMDYERDGDVIRFRHEGTDRLRAMLDKRGIPWKDYGHPHRTWWGAWYAEERPSVNGLFLKVEGIVSPEQAVAVTLGRGTCRVDVLNTGDCAGYECSEYIMHCNGCGHEFGHVLYNEDGDVWMSERPNFCPNCGRKVVEE